VVDEIVAEPGGGAHRSRRARPCSSAARSSATDGARGGAARRVVARRYARYRRIGSDLPAVVTRAWRLWQQPLRSSSTTAPQAAGRNGFGPGGPRSGRPLRRCVRVGGEDEHRDEAAETPDERREHCELHVMVSPSFQRLERAMAMPRELAGKGRGAAARTLGLRRFARPPCC